jgi:hypothetical protein
MHIIHSSPCTPSIVRGVDYVADSWFTYNYVAKQVKGLHWGGGNAIDATLLSLSIILGFLSIVLSTGLALIAH